MKGDISREDFQMLLPVSSKNHKIFSAASDLKPLFQKKHTIRVNIISFEVIL